MCSRKYSFISLEGLEMGIVKENSVRFFFVMFETKYMFDFSSFPFFKFHDLTVYLMTKPFSCQSPLEISFSEVFMILRSFSNLIP